MEDLEIECCVHGGDFIRFGDGIIQMSWWCDEVCFDLEQGKKLRDWLTHWIEEQEKKEEE